MDVIHGLVCSFKDPKCLAPAKLQRAASPLILSTMTFGKDEIFQKTLTLSG
jgi:hypothetical protein